VTPQETGAFVGVSFAIAVFLAALLWGSRLRDLARPRPRFARIVADTIEGYDGESARLAPEVLALVERVVATPEEVVEAAVEVLGGGHKHLAAELARCALSLAPAGREVVSPAAGVLSAAGDPEGALAAVEAVRAVRPLTDHEQFVLAEIRFDQGRPEEALSALDDACEADAGSADLRWSAGRLLLRRGRPRDAIPFLQAALTLTRGRLHPYSMLKGIFDDIVRAEEIAGGTPGAGTPPAAGPKSE